ncbi:MAG: hypothetical protein AAF985_24435, partial [Bacteroidota bacterium]
MSRFFVVFLFALLIISCGNEDNTFDTRRSNLIGEWNVSQEYQRKRADTVELSFNSSFPLSIDENGLAIKEISLLQTRDTSEWFYQYDPEKVILVSINSVGVSLFSRTQIFDVLTNTAEEHQWFGIYNEVDFN